MSTSTTVLPSIRTRLARTVLLIAAAWGLLLALTVGTVLHRSLDRLLDAGLQESAELVYGVLAGLLFRCYGLEAAMCAHVIAYIFSHGLV